MSNPAWLLDRLSFLLAASNHDEYYGKAPAKCAMCSAMNGDSVDFTDPIYRGEAIEQAADELLDHINAGGELPRTWSRPHY